VPQQQPVVVTADDQPVAAMYTQADDSSPMQSLGAPSIATQSTFNAAGGALDFGIDPQAQPAAAQPELTQTGDMFGLPPAPALPYALPYPQHDIQTDHFNLMMPAVSTQGGGGGSVITLPRLPAPVPQLPVPQQQPVVVTADDQPVAAMYTQADDSSPMQSLGAPSIATQSTFNAAGGALDFGIDPQAQPAAAQPELTQTGDMFALPPAPAHQEVKGPRDFAITKHAATSDEHNEKSILALEPLNYRVDQSTYVPHTPSPTPPQMNDPFENLLPPLTPPGISPGGSLNGSPGAIDAIDNSQLPVVSPTNLSSDSFDRLYMEMERGPDLFGPHQQHPADTGPATQKQDVILSSEKIAELTNMCDQSVSVVNDERQMPVESKKNTYLAWNVFRNHFSIYNKGEMGLTRPEDFFCYYCLRVSPDGKQPPPRRHRKGVISIGGGGGNGFQTFQAIASQKFNAMSPEHMALYKWFAKSGYYHGSMVR